MFSLPSLTATVMVPDKSEKQYVHFIFQARLAVALCQRASGRESVSDWATGTTTTAQRGRAENNGGDCLSRSAEARRELRALMLLAQGRRVHWLLALRRLNEISHLEASGAHRKRKREKAKHNGFL